MYDKLHSFLDGQFAPYGDFPSRAEVVQELRANLDEKFDDLKSAGKTDEEAYRLTIESFGDVGEIMEHVPLDDASRTNPPSRDVSEEQRREEPSRWAKAMRWVRGDRAAADVPAPKRLTSSVMHDADLAGVDLSGADFSTSSLVGARYDGSNLRGARFRAAALAGASFVHADMSRATLSGCDLHGARLDGADLTGATLRATAFRGATFAGATLKRTNFEASGFRDVSFDHHLLEDVVFDKASLKGASFRGATLRNVSFRHAIVRGADFDGATMDKLTYAVLQASGATLGRVTIV